MSLIFRVIIFILLFSTCLTEAENTPIPPDILEQIKPYLLPKNHPARKTLDRMFKKQRPTADIISLRKAGFRVKQRKSDNHIYVVSHAKLQDYLLKCLLDSQVGYSDINTCFERIKGANKISEVINKYGFNKFFKVPKKWIYLLPKGQKTPDHYEQKNMILVVEKLNIMRPIANREHWYSSKAVSKELLTALHTILSEVGLSDSVYIDNIPFCSNGKIAFVDTERFNLWPVPFHRLTHNLSDRRKELWLELINN